MLMIAIASCMSDWHLTGFRLQIRPLLWACASGPAPRGRLARQCLQRRAVAIK
jgi:hypothetical protein